MNQNNRTEERRPLQKECILVNQFDLIETQTVDISLMGLGVETDKTLPFEYDCKLTVFISGKCLPPAKLKWTMKDINNTTRLGLKFLY